MFFKILDPDSGSPTVAGRTSKARSQRRNQGGYQVYQLKVILIVDKELLHFRACEDADQLTLAI